MKFAITTLAVKQSDMYNYRFILVFISLLLSFSLSIAQDATISGQVIEDGNSEPLSFVTVFVQDDQRVTETDDSGNFSLLVASGKDFILELSRVGFEQKKITIKALKPGEKFILDIALLASKAALEVEVTDTKIDDGTIKEEAKSLELLPTTTGNIESALPHIALGLNSGTGGELSSQYNVRGGNYDENLIYVNGFEIYRPQLIRSSQQEGLTFANSNLIGTLQFSSGGFESKYGDKLSSVLDIRYKTPKRLGGSIEGSLLGASGHFEGGFFKDENGLDKLKILFGARYKTTSYLLGTLETKGEYTPNFNDIQSYITYDFNKNWQLGILANYNRSEYNFEPVSRSTAFGLINFALQLNSVFEGQESDDFTTAMGGISLSYIPTREKNPLYWKLLISSFRSLENERQDILGHYRLGESSRSLTGEGSDEIANLLGTGTQHNYSRNYLAIDVVNIEIKGGYEQQINESKTNTLFYEYGFKLQQENIVDEINEWERLDSAGYSLNYNVEAVELLSVLKSDISINSNRLSGFFQTTYSNRNTRGRYQLIGGIRTSYWDLNGEVLVSPRLKALWKPDSNKDASYRLSAGYYSQSPFYRELRNPEGAINKDLLSQKSIHFVGGMTRDFKMGNHPKKFRFIAEVYYKHLWDLSSYEVDNVRIRYSGENDATGYVMGADFRLNGEFVPGAESWFNLSILRAREKLNGVEHLKREIGDTIAQVINTVARPSDQTVTASIFFQDYLPKNKNIKTHLNFSFGTGLPFGIKDFNKIYRNTYRFPIYHRTDIGFSFQLWNDEWRRDKPNHFLKFTKNAWLSIEIYNIMQVKNQASKTWIKTIYSQQYAVPNFLTSRRINARLKFSF